MDFWIVFFCTKKNARPKKAGQYPEQKDFDPLSRESKLASATEVSQSALETSKLSIQIPKLETRN
ncbi:hypothetical protein BCU70_04685 [Vibrio sp. 10N.286.49.C2]|nr:hypothetical protein BCU70_04685 [Vibrio sp. 10N.286.49.C2]PMH44046.1 hypothetical protein BCU66_03595 [Vibrio sp. 10N.286.49.B1]PMH83089.1 hypothetical protein BCU58_16095 [Vibrio sp. 10N.286.48.B7]